jgi:hypothetical protein
MKKIQFKKGIRYKNDNGIMKASKTGEIINFENEEAAEEVLYSGFAQLIPEHFPESGRYRIIGPWPVKIDGQAVHPGIIVTLDASQAAELCSKRQALPVNENIWVPGRRLGLKPKRLYEEGEHEDN